MEPDKAYNYAYFFSLGTKVVWSGESKESLVNRRSTHWSDEEKEDLISFFEWSKPGSFFEADHGMVLKMYEPGSE